MVLVGHKAVANWMPMAGPASIEHYLVAMSGGFDRMVPERTYVLGRDTSADVVVSDALASRRHAQIRWQDGRFVLADLESRNGVSVNDRKLAVPHVLDDGDRIRIGGQVFAYAMLPRGVDRESVAARAVDPSGMDTIGQGAPAAVLGGHAAAFEGDCSEGIFDLLQFFEITRRTGRLDLRGDTTGGAIWFRRGGAVHAVRSERTGFEALYDLARRPPPRFAFYSGVRLDDDGISIQGSPTAVLMELASRVDEDAGG